jgi:hypothetical protein
MTEEAKRNPDRHAEKRWAVQLPARYKGPFTELATEKGQATTELITKVLESYLRKHGKATME